MCNFATYELREQVNQTSAPFPRGVNEMEKCGLKPAPSRLVKPPRVAASPCALECKWVQTVSLADYEGRPTDRHVVFGQVIGVYIDERFIRDGLLDTGSMRPIMRAGYHDTTARRRNCASPCSARRPAARANRGGLLTASVQRPAQPSTSATAAARNLAVKLDQFLA